MRRGKNETNLVGVPHDPLARSGLDASKLVADITALTNREPLGLTRSAPRTTSAMYPYGLVLTTSEATTVVSAANDISFLEVVFFVDFSQDMFRYADHIRAVIGNLTTPQFVENGIRARFAVYLYKRQCEGGTPYYGIDHNPRRCFRWSSLEDGDSASGVLNTLQKGIEAIYGDEWYFWTIADALKHLYDSECSHGRLGSQRVVPSSGVRRIAIVIGNNPCYMGDGYGTDDDRPLNCFTRAKLDLMSSRGWSVFQIRVGRMTGPDYGSFSRYGCSSDGQGIWVTVYDWPDSLAEVLSFACLTHQFDMK